MRIIAGHLRGRTLKSPSGEGCRPAMGRTREALFSMLEARGVCWAGTRVLDLFAGSGSLAFEAVSRGAPVAVLVEQAPHILRCLEANVQTLDVANQVRIVREDVTRYLRRGVEEPFDMIFLDPPYRKGYTDACLAGIVSREWLAPEGLVSAEIEKDVQVKAPAGLDLLAERLFGQTRVCIWRKSPPTGTDQAGEQTQGEQK